MEPIFFPPRITHDTQPFWDGCKSHQLLLQRCDQCGHLRWPAGQLCPQCLGDQATHVPLSGRGRVYSYVVYRRPFHPDVELYLPYVVATIDLEEGPRLLSNLVGQPPEEVRCSAPVQLLWLDSGGYCRPVFTLKEVEE